MMMMSLGNSELINNKTIRSCGIIDATDSKINSFNLQRSKISIKTLMA